MHLSGKIGIPIGIVMLLLGVGIAISAISIFEEAESIEDFMTEPSSEITKKFTDDDDEGSAGWYIMIQGDYFVDNNENGILDACEELNLTVTDSQGNNVMNMSGNVYCELDGKTEWRMEDLDDENVDPDDEWIIVGIFCDTLDEAEMNGYYETSRNEDGEESEKWVETAENDRCRIGDEYTFNFHNSTTEMVLFDRDAQAQLEVEGFLTLCGGVCCGICSLIFLILAVISGFTMKESDVPGAQFISGESPSMVSPAPVSGVGSEVPGTYAGGIPGAGPAILPSSNTSNEKMVPEDEIPVLDLSSFKSNDDES